MAFFLAYPWAFAYGLYFYALFQFVFFARFGAFNTNFSVGDFALYAVGVLSVLLCQYFSRKLRARRWLMTVPFVVAMPFAYVWALGGGLFGWFGVVIFGFIPFLIALPLGYWLIRRFTVALHSPPAA